MQIYKCIWLFFDIDYILFVRDSIYGQYQR